MHAGYQASHEATPGYGQNHAWPYPPYRAMPHAYAPAYARKQNPAKPFRPVELVALLALVVGVDLSLWHEGASGGFGLALLFTVLPALMFVAVKKRYFTPRVGIIGLLTALVAIRCAYEATPGVVLSGLALVGALAFALRRRRLFVPDIFLSALASVGRIPSRLVAAFSGVQALVARTRVGHVSLAPILVPAVLVAAFLGVFALANPVVAHGLGAAIDAIANVVSFPSPLRIIFWLSVLIGGTVLLRPGMWTTRGKEAVVIEGDAPIASDTSVQIARNALIGLNALFVGFIALDAKFLIVGSAPAGMTTQQYAHQGAFWLTVALLMLTAVIGFFFRGALAHDPSTVATRVRAFAYAWMGQGLVLALATYRRIGIHITHSGLSDLRIVGILGTTLVVSGLLLIALKLKKEKTFTWLVRRQLDAFALTAIVYSLTSTHALGAAVNVQRARHGEYRPLLHAFAQTHHAESATTYIPLLNHEDQRVREGVAALLREERNSLRREIEVQTSLRERDLASRHALAQLEAAPIDAALGNADPDAAKNVLLEVAHVANEDRSLEEILSIPAASRSGAYNASERSR